MDHSLPCRFDGTNKSKKDGSCLRCDSPRGAPCAGDGTNGPVHYDIGLPGAICGDHSANRRGTLDLEKVTCPECKRRKWNALRPRKQT